MVAGGNGCEPSDQLMYEPIRCCPVVDPFGTKIVVIGPSREKSTDDSRAKIKYSPAATSSLNIS